MPIRTLVSGPSGGGFKADMLHGAGHLCGGFIQSWYILVYIQVSSNTKCDAFNTDIRSEQQKIFDFFFTLK